MKELEACTALSVRSILKIATLTVSLLWLADDQLLVNPIILMLTIRIVRVVNSCGTVVLALELKFVSHRFIFWHHIELFVY